MRVLPESTERLLRVVDALPGARGLLLAGGTALALHIQHRSSADLDFVFASMRLPRRRIADLAEGLRRKHRVDVLPNVAAEQDFLDNGLELSDYQQDYSVDGVKITFLVPDPQSLRESMKGVRGVAGLKTIQVVDTATLFLMKAVTLNNRITTRDLFDLHTLIENHGFSVARIFEAAARFNFNADVLKARLLHASRRRDDPGIETPSGTAPSFEQLKAYFSAAIDRLEQEEAERAFQGSSRGRSRPR